MKKILLLTTTILLSAFIIGCGSPSKPVSNELPDAVLPESVGPDPFKGKTFADSIKMEEATIYKFSENGTYTVTYNKKTYAEFTYAYNANTKIFSSKMSKIASPLDGELISYEALDILLATKGEELAMIINFGKADFTDEEIDQLSNSETFKSYKTQLIKNGYITETTSNKETFKALTQYLIDKTKDMVEGQKKIIESKKVTDINETQKTIKVKSYIPETKLRNVKNNVYLYTSDIMNSLIFFPPEIYGDGGSSLTLNSKNYKITTIVEGQIFVEHKELKTGSQTEYETLLTSYPYTESWNDGAITVVLSDDENEYTFKTITEETVWTQTN